LFARCGRREATQGQCKKGYDASGAFEHATPPFGLPVSPGTSLSPKSVLLFFKAENFCRKNLLSGVISVNVRGEQSSQHASDFVGWGAPSATRRRWVTVPLCVERRVHRA